MPCWLRTQAQCSCPVTSTLTRVPAVPSPTIKHVGPRGNSVGQSHSGGDPLLRNCLGAPPTGWHCHLPGPGLHPQAPLASPVIRLPSTPPTGGLSVSPDAKGSCPEALVPLLGLWVRAPPEHCPTPSRAPQSPSLVEAGTAAGGSSAPQSPQAAGPGPLVSSPHLSTRGWITLWGAPHLHPSRPSSGGPG